jgi:uncharacterized protein
LRKKISLDTVWYRQRFLRLKAARAACQLLLAALIFAGCGTQAPDQSAPPICRALRRLTPAFICNKCQQSSDDSKTNWQLLAIRALLKEGKSQQAAELFNQLPQKI